MIGTTVSHYRITEKLGAGGMGEVCRARDTKRTPRIRFQMPADPVPEIGQTIRIRSLSAAAGQDLR